MGIVQRGQLKKANDIVRIEPYRLFEPFFRFRYLSLIPIHTSHLQMGDRSPFLHHHEIIETHLATFKANSLFSLELFKML